MGSQPSQQLVGFVLAAEVEVILVGLERPKPGEGIGRGFGRHRGHRPITFELRRRHPAAARGRNRPTWEGPAHRASGTALSEGPRRGQADRHDRSGLHAAEAGDLLQLAQISCGATTRRRRRGRAARHRRRGGSLRGTRGRRPRRPRRADAAPRNLVRRSPAATGRHCRCRAGRISGRAASLAPGSDAVAGETLASAARLSRSAISVFRSSRDVSSRSAPCWTRGSRRSRCTKAC